MQSRKIWTTRVRRTHGEARAYRTGDFESAPRGSREHDLARGATGLSRWLGGASRLFKIARDRLVIELAQIEGGGEGVLVSMASLAKRYATLRALSGVEWIVHAVSCAKPNPKLRRVLEHRGFIIKEVAGIGEA